MVALTFSIIAPIVYIAYHDSAIEINNQNQYIIDSMIDKIINCDQFNNPNITSYGYQVKKYYFDQKDKFVKDNHFMYDYIETKGIALGCINK